ncbi:MAG: DUF1330 domain-containing protein [Mycobacterium sp.]|nr:DUF1330 domain-containing protein [Mycobacterium sp.]
MAKGYVLLTETVTDPEGMKAYAELAGPAMGGATVLSFDRKPTVVEGSWECTQTVLLEFESVQAANDWYYSDAYQAAAKLRQAAATSNGVILSGF